MAKSKNLSGKSGKFYATNICAVEELTDASSAREMRLLQ
jgi:hypothetical protein